MTYSRRSFLTRASATSLVAAIPSGLAGSLINMKAQAATTDGYKAIVCVFLLGGLDCHDTVIPYDTSSYNTWAQIRASLVQGANGSRDLENLLPLSPQFGNPFNPIQYALPPDMSGLHGLFEAGNAAIIGNVGPLIEPTNATSFDDGSVQLPPRLFSHNDQQSTWQSSSPEGAQFGWGGRFADAMLAAGANSIADFTAITALGNELFLTGENTSPYQVNPGGALSIEVLNFLEQEGSAAAIPFISLMRSDAFLGTNLLELDMAAKGQQSYDANNLYNDAFGAAIDFETPFPAGFLSTQLKAIAQTISIREQLGATRQIFFVGIGGFDTHDTQAADLPGLQSSVSGAITAFFQATQELGVENDVTLFTASDFGRTLAVNGDGTDHGWGGHHFVVGGAVNGREIYGSIPDASFGHAQDSGGGRLIPTTSVEQLAEPMGRWFGLSDEEIMAALPNLSNFTGPSLSFI